MATFGKFDTFDHLSQEWSVYKSRLFHWFVANDINEESDIKQEKRKAILVSALTEASYKLVRDLIFPETIETASFAKLTEVLDAHFKPKRCGFSERWSFYAASQGADEELADWAARVRGLALHCGFTAQLQETLRDRFVLGLQPGPEREKLFEKDMKTLTLEEALSTAQSVRGARVGAKVTTPAQVFAASVKKPTRAAMSASSTNQGIKCLVCGYRNHDTENCRFKKYKCRGCNEIGHLKKMCPKKGSFVVQAQFDDDGGDGEYPTKIIGNIRCRKGEPMVETVKLAGKFEVPFHVDTGSHVTAIPNKIYKRYFRRISLSPSKIKLINYTGGRIATIGIIKVPVTYEGKTRDLNMYVIPHAEVALLGRDFIAAFELQLCSIKYGEVSREDCVKAELCHEYSDVFADQLGRFNKLKVHLHLKPEQKPIFCKARTVPFALKKKLDDEIDRLVKNGVLVPVSHSSYATPVVPVLKSNGSIRLCADYSVTLNKQLEVEKYPLPKIEELFARLHGGQEFSKLDLSAAYNQLELDEESQPLTCINTHRGLFQYTRLVFGLSSSPAIFQRALETILVGIPGVLVFLDDILITGRNREEHVERLHSVFRKLQDSGLVLQKDKCKFLQTSLTYLGYVIDKNGLHKSEEKVKAILQAENPKNVSKLKSFLGMVNYYRSFIPDAATVLSPLHNLLCKDVKWKWTEEHERAVSKIKNELASERVLAHYNPQAQLCLLCDAGPEGVSAILSQVENGKERPISYASRSLTVAEKNYSQLQKEATAIIFAVKRFHHYLYGRQEPFLLKTDHKPLLAIFGHHKGIPEVTANRLQRYALYLSAYNFKMEYVKGVDNAADFLSRSPLPPREEGPTELCPCVEDRASYINFVSDGQLPVTREDIRRETSEDSVLRSVMRYVSKGWPAKNRDSQLSPYYHCRLQLSCEEGCLMRGHKLVIPAIYRQRMLDELHRTHLGIVKTKAEVRSRFWWPQVDADIERRIGSCDVCNQLRPSPPRAPPAHWEFPPQPWYRVHLDFLGPIQGNIFLIVVDAYSKWPEVFIMKEGYSSSALIEKVQEVMARFGVPHTLVSDNGTSYVSREFRNFCKLNGINFITAPTYHPPSNGQAESGVKFTKKAIKSIAYSTTNKKQMQSKILEFLFQYRNSVHTTTERSPANLLFGRQLRSRLDDLKPRSDTLSPSSPDTAAVTETVKKNQSLQTKYHGGSRTKVFEKGDNVLFKNYKLNKKFVWQKGVIVKVLGKNTYLVYSPVLKTTIKKHLDHIIEYKGTVGVAGAASNMHSGSWSSSPNTAPSSPRQTQQEAFEECTNEELGEEEKKTNEEQTTPPALPSPRASEEGPVTLTSPPRVEELQAFPSSTPTPGTPEDPGGPKQTEDSPPLLEPVYRPGPQLRPRTRTINYKL